MASSGKTPNFNLSQYSGIDTINYLDDYNQDMLIIDGALQENRINQNIAVSLNNPSPIGTRKQINFINGDNVEIEIADNEENDVVDVRINSISTASSGPMTWGQIAGRE